LLEKGLGFTFARLANPRGPVWRPGSTKEHPDEEVHASERTREKLKALIEGPSEAPDGRSELVWQAARLIIEEALEGEAKDTLGRDYYERGALPGAGYRNGTGPDG
jgi:hypothetical protein